MESEQDQLIRLTRLQQIHQKEIHLFFSRTSPNIEVIHNVNQTNSCCPSFRIFAIKVNLQEINYTS